MIGKGEFPAPPKLFKGTGVSGDPVGVAYWKIANGIRLTVMPGLAGSLSVDEMWQVSLLLANTDKPAAARTALRTSPNCLPR